MNISLSFNSEKSLNPSIVDLLKNVPEQYVFGHLHPNKIRHPGAIYNFSLEKFLNDFVDFFRLRDLYLQTRKDKEKNELLVVMQSMIAHLSSFEDEAYLILVALCPPSSNNPKFAYEWLNKNNFKIGADFFRSSSSGAMQIWNEINNRIKHNGQRLSSIEISDEKISVEGFYVEGTASDGAVAPDPEIHEKLLNGNVGLSYNRTVLVIFSLFYHLSDKLGKSIQRHLKQYHNFNLVKSKELQQNNRKIKEIWDNIIKLECFFFPKEYNLKFPKINKSNSIYSISFPHGDITHIWRQYQVKAAFHADGYSSTYKIPKI